MPIAGQTPKQVVHTEMSKFKSGELHSGSPEGPKVTDRAQAIAIALSEAGKAKPAKKSSPARKTRRWGQLG